MTRWLPVLLLVGNPIWAAPNPLAPIRLDTPRDTVRTFMEAMKTGQLDTAVRTLDLSGTPAVLRGEMGRETAALLKETLDRVVVIQYSQVPNDLKLARWTIPATEIAVVRNAEGRVLFSQETVARVKEFYAKVKHLPYLRGTTGGAGYKAPWLERNVPAWARKEILFYPNWKWLGLLLAIFLGLVIKRLTRSVIVLFRRVTGRSEKALDYRILVSIERPLGLIIACAFWFFCIHLMSFQGTALYIFTILVHVTSSLGVIWGLYRLTDIFAETLQIYSGRSRGPLDDALVPLISKSLKIFVVLVGTLVIFENLGFNVMSIFAGLGLGGLAFALAAKDTCANLFGSLMIFLDRPFRIGDWILVDGREGNVEDIGFRSTRIRTFYNSIISVPNSTVANACIDNMGRRRFRRIVAHIGLTYSTPPEKLEAFLEGVKNIVRANPHTRKDYFHVVFNKFGNSALEVMLYCFLQVPDWATELVERQNLYLEILRLAEELGVDFAFPSQSIYVETMNQEKSVPSFESSGLLVAAQKFGPKGEKSKPGGQGIFTPPYQDQSEIGN